jgi:VanZ family protein
LTVFLLVPDPAALLGLSRPPGPPGGRGIHLVFFAGLGALTFAARWSIRGATLTALLVVYAASTELLQTFVPPRTVELLDFTENIAGLALGIILWRLAQRWSSARPSGDW